MKKFIHHYLVLISILLLTACGSAVRSPEMQATVDAISTAAVATISERLLGDTNSTPVPSNGDTIQEAVLPETPAAGSGLEATNEALAASFAPFKEELPGYSVNPDRGSPGWVHPPLSLEAQGPSGFQFYNEFATTVSADFVMTADITWRAAAEETGCGFVLRSDGNQNSPSQYVLGLTRFDGGRVYFAVMDTGATVSEQVLDPSGDDSTYSIDGGSTNRLAVVARGYGFEVYTNGVFIGTFNPNQPPLQPSLPPPPPEPADQSNPLVLSTYLAAKKQYDEFANRALAGYNEQLRIFQSANREFERGFNALAALAQQGSVSCTFENAWLWHITE